MMIYTNTPPAYSFPGSGKDNQPGSVSVPGPGHYDPTLKSPQLLTPFPKSEKFAPIKGNAPGPGAYEARPVIGEGPKASIHPRHENKYETEVPGPGHYDPNLKSPQLLTHFPKSEKFAPIKSDAPGPGAYEARPAIGEGPKASIHPRHENRYDSDVPGPGYYEPVNPKHKLVPIHFSKAPKDQSYGKNIPGPGEYNPLQKEGGPSWSFKAPGRDGLARESVGSEGRMSARYDSPGPGYYDINQSLSVSLPGFWASKSKKEPSYLHPSATPGPASYDPNPILKVNNRSPGMGKSAKLPDYTNGTPGPGHYDPKSLDSPVKVTLKPRLTDLELERKKLLPGPGYYSPVRPDELHKATVALSKGERDYSYYSKGNVPPPGAYDPEDPRRNKRGFTFSKAGKLVLNADMGPYYEIPSSIGIIQSYHKRK